MTKKQSLKLQRLPDSIYSIRFLNVKKAWIVYNDLIRTLHIIEKEGSPKEIILDFSELSGSVYSSSATSVSGIIDFFRRRNGWKFSFAARTPNSYLGTTALNNPLSASDEKEVIISELFDRVIRFECQDDATFVSNAIIRRLKRTVECENGVLEGLSWCMNEILENVFIHSGANCGYIMVQVHNRKKVVNVSVFDTGCGLFKSLAKSDEFRPANEMESIKMAVEKGVTENRQLGQGNGMYGLGKIIKENKGHLLISTGHCSIEYDYETGKETEREGAPILSKENLGTRIDFTIQYQRKTDIIKALDGYKPYEVLERDLEDIELEDGSVLYKVLENAREDVGSRSSGKAIRTELFNLAKTTPKTIYLDFSGIDIITSSFADEMIGKMVSLIGFSQFSCRFRIIHANEYVSASIDRAVAIRQKELSV